MKSRYGEFAEHSAVVNAFEWSLVTSAIYEGRETAVPTVGKRNGMFQFPRKRLAMVDKGQRFVP